MKSKKKNKNKNQQTVSKVQYLCSSLLDTHMCALRYVCLCGIAFKRFHECEKFSQSSISVFMHTPGGKSGIHTQELQLQ